MSSASRTSGADRTATFDSLNCQQELKIALTRWTVARRPDAPETLRFFRDWVARGYAGEMACNLPIPEQGAYLRSVVSSHVRHYGVPMNGWAIGVFRYTVGWLWHRVLKRRSQNARRRLRWDRMKRIITRWLPPARICHPYPLQRGRHHPRREPDAVTPLVRVCGGGYGQP